MFFYLIADSSSFLKYTVQSADAVEYTDCISAEG